MRILALDAATKHLGYTLATNDQLETCGEWALSGQSSFERIKDFMMWLNGMFEYHNINLLFYELPRGNKGNQHTNKLLGALEFAAWFICDSTSVLFYGISPSQVKATGIYKVLNKDGTVNTERYKLACEYWPEFSMITKHDGSINKAAMERQDDIVDSIGAWLAGLKELGYE